MTPPRRQPWPHSWWFGCALVARLAESGTQSQEYQDWAAKVYDKSDKQAQQRGDAIACSFCQILVGGVQKQMALNRDMPRAERHSEEDTEEVMLELCKVTAPRLANAMHGFREDAEMLCRRVVKEHVSDMFDAASLGEDMDGFCKDNKVCPFGIQAMNKILKMQSQDPDGKSAKKARRKVEKAGASFDFMDAMATMSGLDKQHAEL